jgi:hypothetical protein
MIVLYRHLDLSNEPLFALCEEGGNIVIRAMLDLEMKTWKQVAQLRGLVKEMVQDVEMAHKMGVARAVSEHYLGGEENGVLREFKNEL